MHLIFLHSAIGAYSLSTVLKMISSREMTIIINIVRNITIISSSHKILNKINSKMKGTPVHTHAGVIYLNLKYIAIADNEGYHSG